jgi:tellurite resistance protein TerC
MASIATQQWWIYFFVFMSVMLALDLFVFNRKSHHPSYKESLAWVLCWVSLALGFNFILYKNFGQQIALEFLTGYVIEQSLSVDNLFVFILIFKAFNVPKALHHKVLFWGIIGAVFFRISFILAGSAILSQFHWMFYVFGAFLIYSGYKIFTEEKDEFDPKENFIIKKFSKVFRIVPEMTSTFFIKKDNRTYATALFLTVVSVEVTDVIFAVDSIPAIFAVTKDPYIVFTSNIFAIMGLRNMYFLISKLVSKFTYLSKGLGVLLVFIGVKMLIMDIYKIPTLASLVFIFLTLSSAILFSMYRNAQDAKK